MNIETLQSFSGGEFIDNTIYFIGKNDSGQFSKEIKFPLNNPDELHELLSLSKPAYFGKNDKAVLDPEYRLASVIYPQSFLCNFDPNNYDIIDKIQTSMGEKSNNIKFVQDKLNIYSKDGHFKVHKDTPRSPNMIGTLVVCLPCEFVGGDLVLHTYPLTTFQFDKKSSTYVQWAAFYGDIDHEVKPVISGNRITITYLINKTQNITNSTPQSIDFVKQLLKNPDVLRKGGFLGYGCRYLYSKTNETPAFKGEDGIIYDTFKSMGLQVVVEQITSPIVDCGYKCDCCQSKPYYEFEFDKYNFTYDTDKKIQLTMSNFMQSRELSVCLKCSRTKSGQAIIRRLGIESAFYTSPVEYMNLDDDRNKAIAFNVDCRIEMSKACGKRLVGNIYWLNDPCSGENQLAIEADILYGNEPSTGEMIYKQSVFLVYIADINSRELDAYQPNVIPPYTVQNNDEYDSEHDEYDESYYDKSDHEDD
jgi:hypothetical protein